MRVIQKLRIMSCPRYLEMFFLCTLHASVLALLSTSSSTWENHISSLDPVHKMKCFIISLRKSSVHTPDKFIMPRGCDVLMIEM